MSEIDITREAVERIAERLDHQAKDSDWHCTAIAKHTILALRDALDKAEWELEDRSLTSAEQALRAVKAERERDEMERNRDEVERERDVELRRTNKAERERDDYAQAARVEASARRRFMQERDEALEALRPFAALADQADSDDGEGVEISHATVGGIVTLAQCRAARAILAKHELKP